MTISNEDKLKNERFLEALAQELQIMSDTDALEGENAEDLVKLGERLLKNAREDAGKLRMAEAKRKLSVVSTSREFSTMPTVAEAREYLQSLPELTLAARNLDELSDTDVLDLFCQAKILETTPDSDVEGHKE